MLNTVYAAAIAFGKNWRRPVSEIVEERYPELSDTEKKRISDYIVQAREDIEDYFCERYTHEFRDSEAAKKANRELQANGFKWMKEQYEWMSDETMQRAASQAVYYAWHG